MILAGGASGLALPPLGWWWVLLVTVPLLLKHFEKTAGLGWRAPFGSGLSFGFGYFCVAFHWIGFAFFVNAADIWMMPFAVGGLALFMSCYWGVALAVAARLPEAVVPRWLVALILLSLAEFLRGRLLTGFPWAVPGLAVDGMGGVAQLVSVVGVNGLTLLVLVWCALPFIIWRNRQAGGMALLAASLVLAGLPLAHVWGVWRMSVMPSAFHGEAMVRLVQPNVSQNDKWRTDNAEAIFDRLLSLSGEGAGSTTVRLVIWPESAVPFLLDEDTVALRRIAGLLAPGQTLLTGAIRREVAPSTCLSCAEPYFTSIVMIDDQGVVSATYDKWRLVPGGEYLPMEGILSRFGFRKVVALPESFTAGAGPRNLPVPGLGPVGMLICYEVIFSNALVSDERPSLLVNVTNDGWFGRSVGPHQHLAQARMRSIEQALPVLRAANTGISAVIDAAGRIIVQTELEQPTFVDSRIPRAGPATVYALAGDLMLAAVMLALMIFLRGMRSQTRQ
jgi:apolipoprotein N-acyltransferase